MRKKSFIIMKTFKEKGTGILFGQFLFLEGVPSGSTQSYIPSPWHLDVKQGPYLVCTFIGTSITLAQQL
jgi:hypothetical protein